MQKSKPQSKQAPFCTTFLHNFFLFSNTIRTFLKQLFWWKPTWTRGQNTPWCKDITRSKHKSRQKTETKRSSKKREHSLNDKSEKRSVLGKWKARQLLQRKFVGVQPFIAANKTKPNWKLKTTDAPRKTHSAWSNKNIVCWKVTRFLPIKKGCLGGIPKLWRLYLLDISWGTWASPSLSFYLFFNSSYHSPIPTLENFLHTKLNIILLATLV
jgi:hypothetical protein